MTRQLIVATELAVDARKENSFSLTYVYVCVCECVGTETVLANVPYLPMRLSWNEWNLAKRVIV